MSSICEDSTRFKTLKMPSDPNTAECFDSALKAVFVKYSEGVPLTRRELLSLAQACITIAALEAAA